MRFIIDMNLSPDWCDVLRSQGFEAEHWSRVGDMRASDREILEWASEHAAVVFTHDLDFSAILAIAQSGGPSVLQMRARDVLPDSMKHSVLAAIHQFDSELARGALLVVEPGRSRCRILPLKRE